MNISKRDTVIPVTLSALTYPLLTAPCILCTAAVF